MEERSVAESEEQGSSSQEEKGHAKKRKINRWSFGVLNDRQTDEVPGSILLLSGLSDHNAPLGLRNTPRRTSSSSIPHYEPSITRIGSPRRRTEKKRTKDGKIILDPQPDESMNDPLNWSAPRRDAALLSLGFYCMVGGGMTTVLAPGFTNVSETYNVSVPQVALTTGLYMMGLGIGSVIASPTAIAFGKRPVYLVASIVFLVTAVWCAVSPSYPLLVVARVVQGMAVSPVECLPSATIAEIFFLHERAYRVGIYTLLLLGGKNLVPLVSAAVIQAKGWRWVFWVVAMIVGGCFCLLFFLVPETFWDRTPRPHHSRTSTNLTRLRRWSASSPKPQSHANAPRPGDGILETDVKDIPDQINLQTPGSIASRRHLKARFARLEGNDEHWEDCLSSTLDSQLMDGAVLNRQNSHQKALRKSPSPAFHSESWKVEPKGGAPPTPKLQDFSRGSYDTENSRTDYFGRQPITPFPIQEDEAIMSTPKTEVISEEPSNETIVNYTTFYRSQPPKTYLQTLKPWSGRLTHDNWFRVALRPFILFAYPSILWSTLVYALSVGWLIVLSESVTTIYRNPETYNFSALQTGLIYISPFIGGVLGTAVAGKVSDIIVRRMSKHNGGIYEPEFRLVMAIPVAICTTIGLMGYGWSAQERDRYIVPTIFFGIISFGCTLGSTTAITFAVDSYRQYAGEALVTLNFSKNIFHGLVFSLFFNTWLDDEGPKKVFLAIGGIQMACLLSTIPIYILGKRARMWTVRKSLMERF